jgi:hypothetical protein
MADPTDLTPAAAWAGVFGTPNVSFVSPRTTTAFFGDTDLTVASWVMPTDTAAFPEQYPYCQWNMNGSERKFYFVNDVASDAIRFGVSKAGTSVAATTQGGLGAMRNGSWYRLVGCHEKGNESRLYVNGQLADRRPHTIGIETGDGPAPQQPWLGGLCRGGISYDVNQYWRGRIGPTSYYTRSWTQQEASWDYNAGAGRGHRELGQLGTGGAALLTGLVAHWEMTEEDTGVGPYVPRRDASPSRHDLHPVQDGTQPRSGAGILPRADPIGEGDRVQRWIDRSPLGNDLTQSDGDRRPYWDSRAKVLSLEAGTSLSRSGLAGLSGRELSIYVVTIVKDATLGDPWLGIRGAGPASGLALYRDRDRLVASAWIGGRTRELSFRLSYPAERLIELHYGGGRCSLWENGTARASTRAVGGFGQPLTSLLLGPRQGLGELLIYNQAHQ